MKTVGRSIIEFYKSLSAPKNLPPGVEVLHPQEGADVQQVVEEFYTRYYSDNNPRRLLIGINPGRFGAGITGINFTGPRQLTEFCGIQHPFGNRSELSAEFIYEMITAYGGVEKFYSGFFITSVSPLGYTRGGVNLNYYDDPALAAAIRPWIIQMFEKQLSFTGAQHACICIGGEKNYKYLKGINDECRFFERIIPVAHPRFIMQYRRKQKATFVEDYLSALDQLTV